MKIQLNFIYWEAVVNMHPSTIKRILKITNFDNGTIGKELNEFFQKHPEKLYHQYVQKKN